MDERATFEEVVEKALASFDDYDLVLHDDFASFVNSFERTYHGTI